MNRNFQCRIAPDVVVLPGAHITGAVTIASGCSVWYNAVIRGDESHSLTKSSLIFVPAGLSHTPPLVNRVDRPIFHFSMVLNSEYNFATDSGETFQAK